MPLSFEESRARFQVATQQRQNFDTLWQEVADLVVPHRGEFTTRTMQGQEKRILIYNSAAPNAASSLAGAVHLQLTTGLWLKLKLDGFSEPPDNDGAMWLYDTEMRMLAYLATQESGFPLAADELYQDLSSFGEGCCSALARNGRPLRFTARALAGTWKLDDEEGIVTDVFRKTEERIRDIRQMFGFLPASIEQLARSPKGAEETRCLVHHVWQRREFDPGYYGRSRALGMPVGVMDMPWGSRYWLEGGSEQEAELSVSGMLENPYVTPRWSKAPDETYGRGPGTVAMPDIKAVNAMARDQLQAGALKTRPPMLVPDASLKYRKLDLTAGGVNWINPSSRILPQAMQTGADPNIGEAMIERTEARIEEAFYLDTIKLPLVRKSHSAMTAEEIQARRQQALARASPVTARLEIEWLTEVAERTFRWMQRSGRLLPPPASIRGHRLKAEFSGPMSLSRLQRETANILEALQAATLLIQADPSVLQNVDSDVLFRLFWQQRGANPTALRRPRQVAQIRNQQMQQAALPQQAAAARDLAAAGKDIGATFGLPQA